MISYLTNTVCHYYRSMMLSVVVNDMISLLRKVNNIIYDMICAFLSGVQDFTVVYASLMN